MSTRKLTPIIFLFILGLALFIVASTLAASKTNQNSPAQVDTFTPIKDSYIYSAQPNTNFGSAGLNIGQSNSGTYRSLLEFDLSSIPANAVVISATLQLYHIVNHAPEGNGPDMLPLIYADSLNGSWVENTVTWNNAPTSTNRGDPALDFNFFPGWHDFDVSNIVDGWVSGTFSNFGLRMRGDASVIGFGVFYSRSVAGLEPRLHVAYFIPTNTPTGTLSPSATPTITPSPTPDPQGTCPGTIVLEPDRDTWTRSVQPATVFGNSPTLNMGVDHVGADDFRYTYLHFPVQEEVPAGFYIHDAWLTLQVDDTQIGQQPPWMVAYYSLRAAFDETTTSWLTQPGAHTYYGGEEVGNTSTHRFDDYYGLQTMVRAWYSGSDPNHGMALIPVGGDYIIAYDSRESANPPELVIVCDDEPPPPPPTFTPTATPTFTPTPTATPEPPTANLVALWVEITQGVQTMDNSVRLVAGKRTFARFHVWVKEPGDLTSWRTTATLKLYHNGSFVATLNPIDSPGGYKNLQPDAEWVTTFDTSFLFEIPSEYTDGTLRLVADVNPFSFHFDETDMSDNQADITVTFEDVPEMFLRMYNVDYRDPGGTTYYSADTVHMARLASWLRRAYPISKMPFRWSRIKYEGKVIWYPNGQIIQYDGGRPGCKDANGLIGNAYFWERKDNPNDYAIEKYYGLVDDGGGFMRGCSGDIPSWGASGPAGDPAGYSGWQTWDFDGSMADWYGGHELGHAYGRHHAQFCEADAGGVLGFYPGGYENYPYVSGNISPKIYDWGIQYGYGAFDVVYGFDYWPDFTIYDPEWKDVMTYCDNIWISDWTYHKIMNKMQSSWSLAQARGAAVDRLLVTGSIDLQTGELELAPAFVIPDAEDYASRVPGDYDIVLYDAGNNELARYPFTPAEIQIDPFDPNGGEPEYHLIIEELVPYMSGTVRVDIEGPDGLSETFTAGLGAPNIIVTSPNGGEILFGDNITIAWAGSEPDGDPLVYNVQYSPDNGQTWQMVAIHTLQTSLTISRTSITAGDQALFRVWASDGIHTSSDVSDAPFQVANLPPKVDIITPEDGLVGVLNQTIGFLAEAYDPDTGSTADTTLSWYSNFDGWLGDGEQISVHTLSMGTHLISAVADDEEGGLGVDTVTVTIYADADSVPNLPDLLAVGPNALVLDPLQGLDSKQLGLSNKNDADTIPWQASADRPWIILSAASGTTPDMLTVSVDTSVLAPGTYYASITVTNANDPTDVHSIPVTVQITPYHIFLPVMIR